MGKWYKQGYRDAKDNRPKDPPYAPGNKHYEAYCEGYEDGAMEVSEDA